MLSTSHVHLPILTRISHSRTESATCDQIFRGSLYHADFRVTARGLSAFSWAFQRLQPGQNVDLVLASTQALCAFANQRTGGSAAAAESVTQSLLAVATLLAAPNSR